MNFYIIIGFCLGPFNEGDNSSPDQSNQNKINAKAEHRKLRVRLHMACVVRNFSTIDNKNQNDDRWFGKGQ